MAKQDKVDGHEAYRDDPDYTAPEMQPGNGEDLTTRPNPEEGIVAATAMYVPGSQGLTEKSALTRSTKRPGR